MRLRNIIFFILIILAGNSLSMSNETLGTLESRFQNSQVDTMRIELLLQMGDYFEHTEYDSALHFYIQALELSRHAMQNAGNAKHLMHLKELEIKCIRYIAFLDKSWEKYDSAIGYYKELLELYEEAEDVLGTTRVYQSLGNIYYYRSQWVEAVDYYQQGLELAQKNSFAKQTADLTSNLASMHFIRGDFVKSLDFYQQALSHYNNLEDDRNRALVYLGLGNIHSSMGNFDTAEQNYNHALMHYNELKDHRRICTIFLSMGSLYFEKEDFERAGEYYQQALSHADIAGDGRQEAQSLLNLGVLYAAKNEEEKAIAHYDKALDAADKSKNKHIKTYALRNKAGSLLRLDNHHQALQLASQSLELAKELESLDDQAQAYKTLSGIRKAQGFYRQALALYEDYKIYSDSLLNVENQKQLNELDAIYQSEQKQQRNELLNLELEKNKAEIKRKNQLVNTFIIVLAFVIILSIAILLHYNQKKITNLEIARQKQTIANNNDQIHTLQEGMKYQHHAIQELQEKLELNQKISEETQAFSRIILSGNSSPDSNNLCKVFQGKSFELPEKSQVELTDIFYIKEENGNIFLAIADANLNNTDKILLNISLNCFIDKNAMPKCSKKAEELNLNLKNHLKDQLAQLKKSGRDVELQLATLFYSKKDNKINYISEEMPLYLAIARNPGSIFKPMHDYQEIQFLEPFRKSSALQPQNNHTSKSLEFKLKKADRLYLINTAAPSVEKDKYDEIKKESSCLSTEIISFLDTHQNMEISLQKDYLDRELSGMAKRNGENLPANITIRGIEL